MKRVLAVLAFFLAASGCDGGPTVAEVPECIVWVLVGTDDVQGFEKSRKDAAAFAAAASTLPAVRQVWLECYDV